MSNKNYTYPRVSISALPKLHSSITPAEADTTVMFVPIVTEKGPHQEVIRVHSLAEFIETFGNLSYERNGQMALNLYNWLNNGGTAYVYRMAGFPGQQKALISNSEDGAFLTKKEIIGTDIDVVFTDKDYKYTENGSTTYVVDIDGSSNGVYRFSSGTMTEYIAYTLTSEDLEEGSNTAKENIYFFADGTAADGGKILPIIKSKTQSEDEYLASCAYKNCLFVCLKDTSIANASTALYGNPKNTTAAVTGVLANAKYFGEFYNNIEVKVTLLTVTAENRVFNIEIILKDGNRKVVVERFPRLNVNNYKSAMVSSEYVDVNFDSSNTLYDWLFDTNRKEGDTITYYSRGALDAQWRDDLDCLEEFWTNTDYNNAISNPTEWPIDIIFDAGYPLKIKRAMMQFINNKSDTSIRPDIVGIFDTYELTDKNGKTGYLSNPIQKNIDLETVSNTDSTLVAQATNIALYTQYFMISDEVFTDQNIYVTPTYFLSKLIAYNDMNYGIQFPTAGIRRGALADALYVNKNPNADEKESYFKDRINYVEKTPREYAFMGQRTFDGSSADEYTALSFLNNIRVLEKMKKELERLGRNYLFEFNDAITLSQLSDVLNKYVMNWISNRTLASGLVTVEKNPWSDEAVDVNLTIRFNGTIEVISVQITIE